MNATNENYYKEKLLQEIESVPKEMTPVLYKIVHLLNAQWKSPEKEGKQRKSLRGIWKGSEIDESLFAEARKSLFSYENEDE